ncbi:hypothetical protein [Chromobacterium sp. IIBBL 290-4]|uniref:hypothetical protein n=1 Tax=Chromobacterium sp. IIBBL 290-4 TaxID=2953890 RepID=UPI0020B71356|nr:hypothetical protein [Chromobacterium sp. IIBBL 290-4]UTH73644.1 hypothetical protein NKT35_19190 [Chromobacterium sp. IIBBL 290-4]
MRDDKGHRIQIEQPGRPRLYQLDDLPGYEIVGVITLAGRSGALARKYSNGVFSMVNSGTMRPLDQRLVKRALGIGGNAGAPAQMQGGGRHNVYLDAESIAIAQALGDGNISRGIRLALKSRTEPNPA